MHIGIVPFLHRHSGGMYQYSLTMLHALYEWKSNGSVDEFIVFTQAPEDPFVAPWPARPGWTYQPVWGDRPSPKEPVLDFFRRMVGEGPHRDAWRWLRWGRQRGALLAPAEKAPPRLPDPDMVRPNPDWERWLRDCGVDVLLVLGTDVMPFETSIPYVLAIHDLQHRLQPEFPEVSANGEWQQREYFFRNGARYATLLLADSEVGKEDILHCYGEYGVSADRVAVLPFLPACYLEVEVPAAERRRVRVKHRLPERYLFFPAQLWPHKNHARVVRALGQLKQERGLQIPLVCCGSYPDKVREGVFQEISVLAPQLRIEDQVLLIGYVPEEDMSGLYAEAAALVLPTFFGPTNIPPLEAWSFGCPVITSDIRGIREQMGDAAVLVDPRSTEAIADGIAQLWQDPELQRRLVTRGRARLASYTPADYQQRLRLILEDVKQRVRGRAVSGKVVG